MPDIGKVLKDEIARISKREARNLLGDHIKTIRNLKREVADLRKQIGKQTDKPAAKPDVAKVKVASAAKPAGKTVWFTSKGIKGMRKRLGLNQSQMAKLCGVTPKAVSLWENSSSGSLNLRTKTRETLTSLRQVTPVAARKMLGGE